VTRPMFTVDRVCARRGKVAHVVLSDLHPEIPPVIKGGGWEIVVDAPLCGRAAARPAPGGLRDCFECAFWLEEVEDWVKQVGAGEPKERAGGLDVWARSRAVLRGGAVVLNAAVKLTDPRWPDESLWSLDRTAALELAGALRRAADRLDGAR
jgi:hypothetical protein